MLYISSGLPTAHMSPPLMHICIYIYVCVISEPFVLPVLYLAAMTARMSMHYVEKKEESDSQEETNETHAQVVYDFPTQPLYLHGCKEEEQGENETGVASSSGIYAKQEPEEVATRYRSEGHTVKKEEEEEEEEESKAHDYETPFENPYICRRRRVGKPTCKRSTEEGLERYRLGMIPISESLERIAEARRCVAGVRRKSSVKPELSQELWSIRSPYNRPGPYNSAMYKRP